MGFAPGRVVVRRQFQRDDLLSRVWVGRVVADDPDGLWLWIDSGSPFRDIAAADGRDFRQVAFGDWPATAKTLRELHWVNDVLMYHPCGQAHCVFLFFSAEGTFRHWYINLEEPLTRWDDGALAGIDTVDQDLDLVAEPDRTWRWKDEDEFAEHLAHPSAYWVAEPAAVWAEGERVAARVAAGQFPFDGARVDYRPDPQWTVPAAMPAGWDRRRAR